MCFCSSLFDQVAFEYLLRNTGVSLCRLRLLEQNYTVNLHERIIKRLRKPAQPIMICFQLMRPSPFAHVLRLIGPHRHLHLRGAGHQPSAGRRDIDGELRLLLPVPGPRPPHSRAGGQRPLNVREAPHRLFWPVYFFGAQPCSTGKHRIFCHRRIHFQLKALVCASHAHTIGRQPEHSRASDSSRCHVELPPEADVKMMRKANVGDGPVKSSSQFLMEVQRA